MAQLFANNVNMQLASNLGATDTSMTVTAGQGSQCPAIAAADANFMLLTLTDKNGNKEIVKVIEHISGSDVFTFGSDESVPHSASVAGRAYEATYDGYQSALAITASDSHTIRMPLTAKTIGDAFGFAAVTASALEINTALDGNTSTAAELSVLHGSNVSNADLVILHDHATDLNNATATPAADKIARYNASGIMKGAELNMTGYAAAHGTSEDLDLSLGSASVGDVIFVTAKAYIDGSSITYPRGLLQDGTGNTASFVFVDENTVNIVYPMTRINTTSYYGLASTLIVVNGAGTVVLNNNIHSTAGTGLTYVNGMSAFFIKKK